MKKKYKKKLLKGAMQVPDIIAEIVKAVVEIVGEVAGMIKSLFRNASAYRRCGYLPSDLLNSAKKMNPRQFEYFCAEIFKCKGYNAKVTQVTNDYGRDIILTKDGETTFVECKHYKGTVGREICQKLLGSAQMFGVEKCIIITTGKFHRNAYEVQDMVGKDKLELIDEFGILKMLVENCSQDLSKIMMKSMSA